MGKEAERKNIYFPHKLVARIKKVEEVNNINFSEFVRKAAEEKLSRIEKEKLEKDLEKGYKAKAKLNQKICEDFKHVDGENI